MEQIALLGTGLLGTSIAERLISKGNSLIVWNRTISKCNHLQKIGANLAYDLSKDFQNNKIIISVLNDGPVTWSVISQIGSLEGKVIIQMGTIGSEESLKIDKKVSSLGGFYLEAPVLGSVPEALKGELLIMIGGNPNKFSEYEYLFKLLSKDYYYLGGVSKASACKLSLNQLIASLTHGFSISLRYIQHTDVDINKFLCILSKSALFCQTFDKKKERMISENYEGPNFNISNLSKDLNLFINESTKLGIDISVLKSLSLLLDKANELDLSKSDYSAIHSLTKQ
ncbi:NAD(P)-dependent oxidoreductase [Prochlorococcus marinus]|uniref:NAD(P)-dependent oxidoreductase n=1 Tax=Prochlorococcus marinus TaxID=1219 RepID=UPI0022B38516|nr:NAD(P)-dependent oxidoreductase [Prochlorococcus marinus]